MRAYGQPFLFPTAGSLTTPSEELAEVEAQEGVIHPQSHHSRDSAAGPEWFPSQPHKSVMSRI